MNKYRKIEKDMKETQFTTRSTCDGRDVEEYKFDWELGKNTGTVDMQPFPILIEIDTDCVDHEELAQVVEHDAYLWFTAHRKELNA